jgi:hypothetical protein
MAKVRHIGLDAVVKHFQDLEDPRSTVNRRHPLPSVLVIALLAVLAGAGGPTAIAAWAATKQELLTGVLDLSHGIPGKRCLPPRPRDPPTDGLPGMFRELAEGVAGRGRGGHRRGPACPRRGWQDRTPQPRPTSGRTLCAHRKKRPPVLGEHASDRRASIDHRDPHSVNYLDRSHWSMIVTTLTAYRPA